MFNLRNAGLPTALLLVVLLAGSCAASTTEIVMAPTSRPSQAALSDAAGGDADGTASADALGEEGVAAQSQDDEAGVKVASAAAQTEGETEDGSQSGTTPEPSPPDQATRDAFYESAGPAHMALLDDTSYEVQFERTLRSDGLFDLSSRATIIVDEVNNTSSVEVDLTGGTWELARSRELSAPPWRLVDPPNLTTQLDPFRQAEFLPVDDLLDGWGSLMQADAVVAQDGPGRFRLELPHAELLSRMHGGSISPWTSVRFVNDAVDRTALDGTTPVVLTFSDGLLTRVEFDFGPMLADAVAGGASFPFTDAVFSETYEIVYVAQASDGGSGTWSTGSADGRYVVGDCYDGARLPGVGAPTTPCSEPHLYEILSVGPAGFGPDDPFPTEDQLSERVQPVCAEAFRAITGHDSLASIFGVSSRTPTVGQWTAGEREFTCYVRLRLPTRGALESLDVHRHEDRVSPAGMRVGDCIDGLFVLEVARSLVDCSAEHDGQVILVTTIDQDGPRPGYDWFDAEAVKTCGPVLASLPFEDVLAADASALGVQRFVPTEDMWAAGERFFVCVAASDVPFTGSMLGG